MDEKDKQEILDFAEDAIGQVKDSADFIEFVVKLRKILTDREREKKGKICQWEGCQRKATSLAYDKVENKFGMYCDIHDSEVAGKNYPEYINVCPYCGCVHGVN